MTVVEGKCYAAGGASFERVKVKLYESGILSFTKSDSSLISERRRTLKVSDKLGSIPREIILPNSDLLVLESDVLVDAWLANGKKDLSRFERSPKAVLASIVALPLALYFIFAIAVPKAAIVFAPLVPDSVIEISSDHTLRSLDLALLEPSKADQEKTLYLHRAWTELLATMPLEHERFTVLFRNSESMGPNAFALPNGTIVFTDQLLELVNYDEDILTAIFMHEIGHVEQHHSVRLVSQVIVSSFAINYFIGDVGALVDLLASTGNTIATNKFTQNLEWEADNFALNKLQSVGKDPLDFARGMQKFSELRKHNLSELEQLFSSHPLTDERINNALKFAGFPVEYREKLIDEPEQEVSNKQ